VQDETLTSYIERLAAANHSQVVSLVDYLNPGASQPDGPLHWAIRSNKVAPRAPLATLATASGFSVTVLAYALPELRDQHHSATDLKVEGRNVYGNPNTRRLACRHCMAAKRISHPVTLWMRHDQNVCRCHSLWVGPGAQRPSDQIELSRTPEVIHAQRRHNRLLRRHDRVQVQRAFADAAHISDRWAQQERFHQDIFKRAVRMNAGRPWNGFYSAPIAAQYPRVIALTGMFLSLHWRQAVVSTDLFDLERFYFEVSRRVIADYVPAGPLDPLVDWVTEQRKSPKRRPLLDVVLRPDLPSETL
jgi:hypothetical protein